MRDIVNLMNEIGMLADTPRSGFAFLGSGKQSVAEHCYRMTAIAILLAKLMDKSVNLSKLTLMCLYHDLPEARTGDLNYMNKKYVNVDTDKALKDIEESSPFGMEITELIKEYEKGESHEAIIAHDADQLELLLVLKKEYELGNMRAMEWFDRTCKRLSLEISKKLAEEIVKTPTDAWWFKNKDDPHWITGVNKKDIRDGDNEDTEDLEDQGH